jgi:hypothetical protein
MVSSAAEAYDGLAANKGCGVWLVTAPPFATQLSFPFCSAFFFYVPFFSVQVFALCSERRAKRRTVRVRNV